MQILGVNTIVSTGISDEALDLQGWGAHAEMAM